MKNLDIRIYANKKGVYLWQIAEELGYSHESAFSRALRHELAPNVKKEIMKIIDELGAKNN